MPRRKINKEKETQRFIASADLVNRWQICQKIGKAFYHTELTHEAVLAIKTMCEDKKGMKEIINKIFN